MRRPSRECALVAPMLTAHAGELSAEELALLESHLTGCDGCRLRALDFRAAEGIVGEALLAEAAEVDFSRFADGVMERIARAPAHVVAPVASAAPASAHPGRGPARRPEVEGLAWPRILSWVRAHRAAAVAGTLAPTLAAAALIVYLATSGTAASRLGEVEVVAEGRAPMVLQTSEGPVVLLDEPGGT